MKFAIIIFALSSLVYGQEIINTANDYLVKYGIPLARKIKKSEDARAKAGVIPGNSTKFPWEAGIIIDVVHHNDVSVCSGAVLTINRIITAAHCWFDGLNQAWRYTVVLGSTRLFSGGLRIQTRVVFVHPDWSPGRVLNDIALVQIPPVRSFSDTLQPMAIPHSPYMQGYFLGDEVIACGFGIGGQEIGEDNDALLNHITLRSVDYRICSYSYRDLVTESNMCTVGYRLKGPCEGDTGGPLMHVMNNRTFLVGILSYGSVLGCDAELPFVYTKITAYKLFLDDYLAWDLLKFVKPIMKKADKELQKKERWDSQKSNATPTDSSH